MMNIEIVKMELSHIPALAEIEKLCFSTPWSENALKDELGNSHGRFSVALCGGGVAGYIGAHNIVGEVYITNVAVAPEYRRQGIGEKLVNALVDMSKNEKAEFVTLEVRKSNSAAIKLYEKTGFEKVGERKNFYEAPREDALLMTYRLDGEL